MNVHIDQPALLASYIDHTLLRPEAHSRDIEKLCDEAVKYGFRAICVNPVHVKLATERLEKSQCLIASVVGFPLGANRTDMKSEEAMRAVDDGADEIDMVMQIGWAKTGNWIGLQADIASVVNSAPQARIKVILETGLLTPDEIRNACVAAARAGAHFVKTSTGFLGRGATADDIRLMRDSCPPEMEIKASGGIKTFAQAVELIQLGATRLGTSSGINLVTGTGTGTGTEY